MKRIMSVIFLSFALMLTTFAGITGDTVNASNTRTKYQFMSETAIRVPKRTVYVLEVDVGWTIYKSSFYTFDGTTLEVYDWDTGRKLGTFKPASKFY